MQSLCQLPDTLGGAWTTRLTQSSWSGRGEPGIRFKEFLGQMLGVTRASVNEVARELQEAGAIDYTRGRIKIFNRADLESRSCECYQVVRGEFDRLLGVTDYTPLTS